MRPGGRCWSGSALADEAGINRTTGYEWISRFSVGGVEALPDISRQPTRIVETSGEVVMWIVERQHRRNVSPVSSVQIVYPLDESNREREQSENSQEDR